MSEVSLWRGETRDVDDHRHGERQVRLLRIDTNMQVRGGMGVL